MKSISIYTKSTLWLFIAVLFLSLCPVDRELSVKPGLGQLNAQICLTPVPSCYLYLFSENVLTFYMLQQKRFQRGLICESPASQTIHMNYLPLMGSKCIALIAPLRRGHIQVLLLEGWSGCTNLHADWFTVFTQSIGTP